MLKWLGTGGLPEPGSGHPPAAVKQVTVAGQIVGKWIDPSEVDAFMEFSPDGSFAGGRSQMPARGNWRLDGAKRVTILTVSYGKESSLVLDQMTIEQDQMTFTSSGERGTLKRVK